MGYGDNGAMVNLRQEAGELPCCRCDDQPETASNNSSLSSPHEKEEGACRCTSSPPNPPETALFTEIFVSLRRHISDSNHRSMMKQRRKISERQTRSMRSATSLLASTPYAT
jgi:hypothetical protein